MYNKKPEVSISQNQECIPYEQTIKGTRLANAYVPFQKYCTVYDAEVGLTRGTIFPELDQPYNKKKENR